MSNLSAVEAKVSGDSGKAGASAPAAAAKHPSLSDLTRDFRAREEGDAAARRALNALAVTSSMVSALIEHPGPDSDHQSMVNAARTMLRCADDSKQALMETLSLQSIPWAPYRLMRLVSAAVAERWSTSARLGTPTADVSNFMPVWQEVATHALPEMIIDPPAPEASAALRIAMLDAMQPVMEEIAIFDMLHSDKSAATHARDVILLGAHRALASLAADPMSERSKSMLMQTLLRNGGRIYASAWRRHAEDTIERLQSMTKQAQVALLESHPTGLPLAPIDEAFEGSFVKLVEMVQYLAAPRMPEILSTDDSRPDEFFDEGDDSTPTQPSSGASA